MTETVNINTSPALTFAKLNMNGDRISLNVSSLKGENVEEKISGEGLQENGIYYDELPEGASGEDLIRYTDPFVKAMTLTEDSKVTLNFSGAAAVKRAITVPAGKEVELIEVTEGSSEAAFNSTTYILEKGARLKLVRIQILDKRSLYIDDLRARLYADASLEVVRIDLGAIKSYIASRVFLEGKSAEYAAHGDYLLNREQRLDINMIAEHIAPDTVSDMRYDGVLLDSASKIFRGTLDFKSGCKGAKGSENEDVVLLSEDVRNQSLPIILCGEEDVEGNHGASVGKISDEIIYYLATRGFNEEEATKLLIRSKFNATVSNIPEGELRDEVNRLIDGVLA